MKVAEPHFSTFSFLTLCSGGSCGGAVVIVIIVVIIFADFQVSIVITMHFKNVMILFLRRQL